MININPLNRIIEFILLVSLLVAICTVSFFLRMIGLKDCPAQPLLNLVILDAEGTKITLTKNSAEETIFYSNTKISVLGWVEEDGYFKIKIDSEK